MARQDQPSTTDRQSPITTHKSQIANRRLRLSCEPEVSYEPLVGASVCRRRVHWSCRDGRVLTVEREGRDAAAGSERPAAATRPGLDLCRPRQLLHHAARIAADSVRLVRVARAAREHRAVQRRSSVALRISRIPEPRQPAARLRQGSGPAMARPDLRGVPHERDQLRRQAVAHRWRPDRCRHLDVPERSRAGAGRNRRGSEERPVQAVRRKGQRAGRRSPRNRFISNSNPSRSTSRSSSPSGSTRKHGAGRESTPSA